MASVIMVYSTTDGHTAKICQRLQEVLEGQGHTVTITELKPGTDIDLGPYDRIVIGASIRYGKHRPEVAAFIEQNVAALRSKPSAFFSVNAVARKPEKRDPDTNPYVRKFLQSISWQPPVVGVFGGKIDYPKYGFVDKMMIRFIMWMTKGPTDPNSVTEFTDWDAVDAFGRKIGAGDPA
jgi:menaquinone-dependent protoporphyrinogen oxidase